MSVNCGGDARPFVLLPEVTPDSDRIASMHDSDGSDHTAPVPLAMEGLAEIFSRPALKRDEEHEAKVRELHTKIGELTVERDFFLRGLAR